MVPRVLTCAVAAVLALLVCLPAAAEAQTAKARYEAALAREPMVRRLIETTSPQASAANRTRAIDEATKLIAAYEQVPRRYPTSGYSDNALWQAAGVAEALYKRYARPADRTTALRLYRWLVKEYPASSLVRQARAPIKALEEPPARAAAAPPKAAPPRPTPFPTPASREPA
ncbi:MAG: hypothetical protein Q8L86_18425, partial [Vicinamibacterales bacterium]|nr:hypothetical protein [Vicinamibacterales bacterium]